MQDNLAELISSRICHDLISPVGAIGNGLELMNEFSALTPELELVSQSADSAQAKLKFFRIAFGTSAGSMIGGTEAERVAAEMFSSGRLTLSISESWGARERRLVKLFYLLLLCVESSLPRGGCIHCAPTTSGWRINVKGVPVAAQADGWQHVTEGGDGMTPDAKTIQFTLARQALLDQSITLTSEITDTQLYIEF